MARISSAVGRLRRRIVLAYRVRCARDDAAKYRVHVPSGIWFCDDCRLVIWDQGAFARHTAAHVSV